jgi:hypothetical protein
VRIDYPHPGRVEHQQREPVGGYEEPMKA